MKRKAAWVAAAMVLLVAGCAKRQSSQGPVSAAGIAGLRDSLARQVDFWPGFDPAAIPLAVALRDTTWLFDAAEAPDGFAPAPGGVGFVYPGHHPAVTANSWADFGTLEAAALLIDSSSTRSTRDWAPVAVHESFHVYQRQALPGWSTNEVDLFLYPFDDSESLSLRRQETMTLDRALTAKSAADRAAWAAAALELRGTRYERMEDAGKRYERAVELVEGTAYGVEYRAKKALDLPVDRGGILPDSGYGVQQVRLRGYGTGLACSLLLDEFDHTWKEVVTQPWIEDESGDTLAAFTPLDVLLAHTPALIEAEPKALSLRAVGKANQAAWADVAAYKVDLRNKWDAFTGRQGWKIVVEAQAANLLWPKGFDPMNITRLGDGEVLHTRFLTLANRNAVLHLMNRDAITLTKEGIPLFNGVNTVFITGLDQQPVLREGSPLDTLTFAGGALLLKGAHVESEGMNTMVVLPE